jgi:hypothetical protein
MTKEEKIASCTVDAVGIWDGDKPGLRLYWSGALGFGTYDLVFEKNYEEIDYEKDDVEQQKQTQKEYSLKANGWSECMDNNEDKKFLKQLLLNLADQIEIVE